GAVDPAAGWGVEGDTFAAMAALERYGAATWFRLGDRDLATHLYRTGRLAEGSSLSTVTSEVARAWGVAVHLVPMSDDPVRTRVVLRDGRDVSFQEYFVHLHHQAEVAAIRFDGAASARPGPGVLGALEGARAVVICPSNPFLSIAPVLAVPGVRQVLEARRDTIVAVSPIVAGAALKGPADRLMTELGHDPSVVGVARLYAPLAATLVVDEADAALAPAVEAEGVRCVVTPSIMSSPAVAAGLAAVTLQAVGA
ncbi:MAG: YvcK family protein, partial [Acidimicrobiales bacterium]|nr:YvcK family protein [Acidimicrobiales bacterium]